MSSLRAKILGGILIFNPVSLFAIVSLSFILYGALLILVFLYALVNEVQEYLLEIGVLPIDMIVYLKGIQLPGHLEVAEGLGPTILDTQNLLIKALITPLLAVYVTTKFSVYATCSLLHYTTLNVIALIPLFGRGLKTLSNILIAQVSTLRIVVKLLAQYLILPLLSLATPFIEALLEASLWCFTTLYKCYPLLLREARIWLKRAKALLASTTALLFHYFLHTYEHHLLPIYRQSREVARTVGPVLANAVLDLVALVQRLGERVWKPVLVPLAQALFHQIRRAWVVVWGVVVYAAARYWDFLVSPYLFLKRVQTVLQPWSDWMYAIWREEYARMSRGASRAARWTMVVVGPWVIWGRAYGVASYAVGSAFVLQNGRWVVGTVVLYGNVVTEMAAYRRLQIKALLEQIKVYTLSRTHRAQAGS